MLIRSLNVDRGGITKASIKRANMFAKKYKKVIIITTIFQAKHKQIITKLRKNGELSSNVIVYNFFEEMRNEQSKRLFNRRIKHSVKEKGYTEFRAENHAHDSYRYYQDGFYKMYKRFENGKLNFIDFMDNSGRRIQRSEFDEHGYLVRERFMDLKLNKSRFDKYYNFKGECMLSVHVNPKTDIEGIAVHFPEKDRAESYNHLYQLQTIWLNDLIKNLPNPVLFTELRSLDKIAYNINHPDIKKVAITHSSHLRSPYNDIEKVRPAYRNLFTANKYDDYVFLTHDQKIDVEKIFGKNDKYRIISHSFNTLKKSACADKIERNPYLVVCVARYSEDKRIHEAIESFRIVVKKEPKAQLHLYGNGPLKRELQDHIRKLGLEKNVFLKGYTNDLRRVYQTAICSIITSQREGFGLVIIESMSVGTPVIAYDFKYGPREIITDSEDGFIVENGNREQLAEKIVQLMKDDNLRKELSNKALSVDEKFNATIYKEKWLELME